MRARRSSVCHARDQHGAPPAIAFRQRSRRPRGGSRARKAPLSRGPQGFLLAHLHTATRISAGSTPVRRSSAPSTSARLRRVTGTGRYRGRHTFEAYPAGPGRGLLASFQTPKAESGAGPPANLIRGGANSAIFHVKQSSVQNPIPRAPTVRTSRTGAIFHVKQFSVHNAIPLAAPLFCGALDYVSEPR
jgi:hypothetical protein